MLQLRIAVLLAVLLGTLFPPATPQPTIAQTPPTLPTLPTLPAPSAPAGDLTAVAADLRGLVIRDPWYDFGTVPGQPGTPNYAAQDEMGRMLELLGVTWVRLEFHIEASTPAQVEAQIARNDYFIREVAPRHQLKVLGLLSFNLNRGRDPYDLLATDYITDTIYGGAVNDYMQDWLDRARLIANRYEGQVAAYEVLNEQNRLPPDGRPIPAVDAARLHTKFYRFFKNEDRDLPGDQTWREDVKIIVGGLHPAGSFDVGSPKYVSDRDYVRQLYNSDAFRSYRRDYLRWPLDGMGYHPYPEEIRVSLESDIELITTRLDAVRDVLEEVTDPFVPFWITELGYNPAFGSQTEEEQALFLRESLLAVANRRDVETFFWFKYEDFPPATGPNAQEWGVVRIPFTEDNACPGGACYDPSGRALFLRPSFWMFRELTGMDGIAPEPPARITLVGTGTSYISPTDTLTLTAAISRPTVTLPLTVTWRIAEPTLLYEYQRVDVLTDTLTATLVITRTPPSTLQLYVTAGNTATTIQQQDSLTVRELRGRVLLPFIVRE